MKKTLLVLALAAATLSSTSAWSSGFEAQPVENRQNTDFVAGKKAIDAKNWDAAVKSFNRAVKSDPNNPDIYNYLGYAYRKLNVRDLSFENYNHALQLDPNHRGANEYIGIAYLKNGDLASAEKNLARLNTICGTDCEEYKDLQQAITAYKNGQSFTW
jgi:Flp pilus assembly protein TadD